MTYRKVIEQLLEALDIAYDFEGDVFGIHHNDTVDTIQEAKAYLAQPEQSEPACRVYSVHVGPSLMGPEGAMVYEQTVISDTRLALGQKLFAAPPLRELEPAAVCTWAGKIEHLHSGPKSLLVGKKLYTHSAPPLRESEQDIVYRHKNGDAWFKQSAKDPLPEWTTEVQPAPLRELSEEHLFKVIRNFGYTTRGQTQEIVEAILAAARKAP